MAEGRRTNDGAEGKGGERATSCDNHLLGHSPANGHALLLEKKKTAPHLRRSISNTFSSVICTIKTNGGSIINRGGLHHLDSLFVSDEST